MRCHFDGSLDVRRGEIVKITSAISDTDPLRVSVIENVTSGKRQVSRIEGVMMVKPPVKLTEPIFGRVKSSQVDQYNTYFEIEEISPKDTESKEEHRDLQSAQDIQVFICYAKEDREKALKLYIELKKEDDINPRIDEESLLPGQNWRIAISNAIRDSRYFVALLFKFGK